MLYPDKPKSLGVENGLKRAAQMTGFQWTPLKPIPGVLYYLDKDGGKNYLEYYMQAGLPQTGVIYSSARIVDKHIGFEVPLETYATALKNPNSVLYTRCLHGTSGHGVGCWYGIVCSAFVSYVHNMPRQVVCSQWPTYPGISRLDITSPEDLDKLQLLDIVLNTKTHVAVVTGILRDIDGKVQKVEVSESTLPVCRRLWFTPEEFKLYWFGRDFLIYRNEHVDDIPYEPNPYSYVEGDEALLDESSFLDYQAAKRPMAFMSDYGNKANYALGEPVIFTVFDRALQELEIMDENEDTVAVPVENGRAVFTPKAAGVYHAYGVDGEGYEQDVEWYVYDAKVTTDKQVYKLGEPITVTFRDAQNQQDYFHCYLKSQTRYKKVSADILPSEVAAGTVTIPGPKEPGTYYFTAYSRSPYAIYGTTEVELKVE